MALVSLTDVTKSYPSPDRGGAPVVAVDRVSLDIEPGDVYGIIGYSGAGKSTLVRLVNALEPATSGSITVDGREITGMPERELRGIRLGIGMIFQQFNLFDSKTVWSNVAYPLSVAGASKAEIASPRRRAARLRRARRQGEELPRPALGRAEAAGRHRPRARDLAAAPARRRGDQRARPRDHAGGARAAASA